MRHIDPYPLPEGTWDCVRGVDPAVCVQHILWYVFGVHAVDGIAHVLPRGHYEGKRQQAHHRERVVQSENCAVNVDMDDLNQVLESPEDVQHVGGRLLVSS